ncbi:hypothetical protein [Flavobacterium geliluteum]|uniref:Uncharacterized protein n=1 Tax=Flavobacterium geliluteum TaxID=2816120 RepID=A0A941AZC0_9FLAO|nr:hypothetical protein [Flavobacterium geliluteum]MBP4138792.1 hypothetical protein [Flavobacterium geliluteum]
MKNSEEKKSGSENEIEKNLEQLNYPASEDIYNQEEKLENTDPEKITNEETIDKKEGEWNENTFNIDEKEKPEDDLDVPNNETEDEEEIDSEEEENNSYRKSYD